MGVIPDGVYDVQDGAWSLIRSLPTTRPDLIRAAGIFQRAAGEETVDLKQIEDQLRNEAPTALPLLEALGHPATGNLIQLLAVLVMVIGYYLSQSDPPEPTSTVNIHGDVHIHAPADDERQSTDQDDEEHDSGEVPLDPGVGKDAPADSDGSDQ